MRVETRMFKYVTHLLLIAETPEEGHAIDLILGDCAKGPISVSGELTCDDGFNPYLRFVSGECAQPTEKGTK